MEGDRIFEGAEAGLAVLDAAAKPLRVNAAFRAIFPESAELKGPGFEALSRALAAGEPSWSGWVGAPARWADCYRIGDKEAKRWLLVVDAPRQKSQRIEAIASEAYRDPVTGLPGLRLLLERLERRYLSGRGETPEPGAFFFIAFDDVYRLDHFGRESKEERVLRLLAERLEAFRREGDLLAYLGSDKFALFRPGVERVQEAEELANALLHLNAEPLAVEGEIFYLNLAVGVALCPFDAVSASELSRLAEKAMREARLHGWNHCVFYHRLQPETRIETLERLRRELPEAIERDEIRFVYQPQFCLKTGRYSGAEMLVRWRHETLGELSPELFLPLAEQSGMIRFITMRALVRASESFKRLEAMGRKDFSLSINLSPSAIFHRDFLENLQFFLTHYELEGRPLHFEITENILAHNMKVMRQTLNTLKERGLGIEIDDYGTGYTSLTTLIELPVDKVKIDRQYVRGLHRDPKVRTIYRAMLQTAEALGLEVIAEGVEEAEELETLKKMGPVCVQGWYFSKPLEEEAFFEFLAREDDRGNLELQD